MVGGAGGRGALALSLELAAMEEDVPVGAMSMLDMAVRDGLLVIARATIKVTISTTAALVAVKAAVACYCTTPFP